MSARETAKTSGDGESIQPGLWIEMRRFEHNAMEEALWRLGFKVWPGVGEKKIEVDATLQGLIKIRRFIDRAIETLRTDGGRVTEQQLRASAQEAGGDD